jgi:hypothetical protein
MAARPRTLFAVLAAVALVGALPSPAHARAACFGGAPRVAAEHQRDAGALLSELRGSQATGNSPAPEAPLGSALHHGSLYFVRNVMPFDSPALVRRVFGTDGQAAREEVVAQLPVAKQPRHWREPVVRVAGKRVYFVFDEAIWSAPLAGGAAPERLATLPTAGALDILVDGACLYWATDQMIFRLALDGGEPRAPQAIADPRTFAPHEYGRSENTDVTLEVHTYLATDGHFLYWPDIGKQRIMRVGRDARPPAPVPLVVTKAVGDAAVRDTPPEPGAKWAPSCLVHRACDQSAEALPVCAAGASGEPWSKVEGDRSKLAGKVVSVRGPLVMTTRQGGRGTRPAPPDGSMMARRSPCKPGECCRADPTRLEIAGGRDGLLLLSYECPGDDSRVCCRYPVTGQTVVATGKLTFHYTGRWALDEASLCAPPQVRGTR